MNTDDLNSDGVPDFGMGFDNTMDQPTSGLNINMNMNMNQNTNMNMNVNKNLDMNMGMSMNSNTNPNKVNYNMNQNIANNNLDSNAHFMTTTISSNSNANVSPNVSNNNSMFNMNFNQMSSRMPEMNTNTNSMSVSQSPTAEMPRDRQNVIGSQNSNIGPSPNKGGMTAQQVLAHLMKMDPEQRNAVISRNPQLRAFLMQVEQQRRMQIQKMQQQRQQAQQQQQQTQNPQNQPLQNQPLQNQPPQNQPPQNQPPQNQQLRNIQVPNPSIQNQPVQNQQQLKMPNTQQQMPPNITSSKSVTTSNNENFTGSPETHFSTGVMQSFNSPMPQTLQQTPQQYVPPPQQQNRHMSQMNQAFQPQQDFRQQQQSTSQKHSPVQQFTQTKVTASPNLHSFQGSVNSGYTENVTPDGISSTDIGGLENAELPKDKIPKKPLQKKGMKKKVLKGASAGLHNDIVITSDRPLDVSETPINTIKQEDDIKQEEIEDLGPFADLTNPVLTEENEWSKLLKSKGMEPDLDLRMYEDMIGKDLEYLKYFSVIQHVKKQNPANINDKFGVNGRIFQRILKDLQFYQQVKAARMQSMKLSPEANGLTSKMWGIGYSGYGNGFTDGKVEFLLPEQSKMPYKDEDLTVNISKVSGEDEYVPIRLEFDVERDGFKLNDTFVWNTNDDDQTLKIFIEELINDYRIVSNTSNVFKKIYDSIKEQISDIHPTVVNPNIDLRFPITLDITIANNQLVDRFDWDLMNQENDPEEFAEVLCAEFALPNEFKTAISHSIREQCQIYLKSLYMIGYKFDGGAIISEDLKEFLRSGFDQNNVLMPRYLMSDFTPSVQELSITNFERIIKERERESKRKKRGVTRVGRRSGFVLPDLSTMPKTFRTPLPSTLFPGSVSIIDDEKYNIDENIETPIEISIPKEQMDLLRKTSDERKAKLEQCQKEKERTMEWIKRIRSRRMRGETLTAAVNVNNNSNNSAPVLYENDLTSIPRVAEQAIDNDNEDAMKEPAVAVKSETNSDGFSDERRGSVVAGAGAGAGAEAGATLAVQIRFGWR